MKHLQKIIEESEAFFFDLDGTLAYTSDLHKKAYKLACMSLNLPYENLIFPVSSKLYEEKKKHYIKLLTTEGVKLNKEIYKIYLNALLQNKKVAIVTNTLQQNVDKIIKMFDAQPSLVISSDNFDKIKPAPDMYEFAIKKIDVSRDKILVFEDSEIGIKSALLAKLRVVDIRDGSINE